MESKLRSLATGSGAERWIACPGSVALGKDIIEANKEWATEGTEAHDLAAQALVHDTPLEELPNEHIRMYVQFCRENAEPPYYVEERLELLGTSGAIDCYCIDGKTGYIFDLKYGIGKHVRAEGNAQLAFYSVALKEKYPQLTRIHSYIIQPRVDGIFEGIPSVTSMSYTWQALAACRRKIERALIEVEEAKRFQSGDHCQFCKARGCCPAYLAYAEATDDEADNLPILTMDMIPVASIPRIAKILQAETRLKGWFAKAKEFLLQQAINGEEVPGFELAPKRTNRKWIDSMGEEALAEELVKRGLSDPWEKSLMSLTKAEKLVNIKDLFEKPDGGQTLKPIKK